MLVAGAASAGECRAGRMRLVSGERVLRVERTSYSTVETAPGLAFRTVLQGRVSGRIHTVEIHGVPGSNPGFGGYAGRARVEPHFPARWGRRPQLENGASLEIGAGPLSGKWVAICE